MPGIIASISAEWLEAKEDERKAIEKRRALEDELLTMIGFQEQQEGVETAEIEGTYTIKVTGRITRKVDANKVQEIAAEHGLTEHLGSLFRWTPAIDAKAWKAADSSITDILSEAITAKPGRPSIAITKLNEE